MVIADTSIWIEFFRHREPRCSHLEHLLEERMVLALECIFGELLQGAKSGREVAVIRRYWESLPTIDEMGLWLEAGEMVGRYNWLAQGVGLIDACIVVGAHRAKSRVWTLDKKLESVLGAEERYRADNGNSLSVD
jgi:predicted nucleic acid-binding protein